jgi:hypothetical protein
MEASIIDQIWTVVSVITSFLLALLFYIIQKHSAKWDQIAKDMMEFRRELDNLKTHMGINKRDLDEVREDQKHNRNK